MKFLDKLDGDRLKRIGQLVGGLGFLAQFIGGWVDGKLLDDQINEAANNAVIKALEDRQITKK